MTVCKGRMNVWYLLRRGNPANIGRMSDKKVKKRPLLTIPQILVLLAIIAAIFVALDLNSRAKAGDAVGSGGELLTNKISIETTRQIELQATLTYVQSDDYIAAYARDEGGYILPNERRIVPVLVDAQPEASPPPPPTPDPAANAQPWQAWWQLLTDKPMPDR